MTNPDRDVELTGEVNSPFLEEELLVGRDEEDWEPRAVALAAESPFQMTPEPGRDSGESRETGESESLDEVLVPDSETGIIDTDNRVRITNTIGVPFRWICHIAIEDQRGRPLSVGTGLLVSDRHVLTAAHVVHDVYKNPQRYSVYVTPARNYGDEPFGRYLVSAKPRLPRNYDPDDEDGRFEYDYALLTLSEAVGTKTFSKLKGPLCFWGSNTCGKGTLFRHLDPAALAAKKALTAGYPGRKGGDKLYCSVGMLHSVALRGHLRTMKIQADATPGQSGSPVWLKMNDNPCLIGVLVGAGEKTNTIVRVTVELKTQLESWIAEDAGTSSAKEVGEWSRLDAEVDEVLEESAGTDESLELESARDTESSWKPEELAEEDEDSHEAATISEECEGELDADEAVNDAGEAETERTVPDQWAAEANADGRDAFVPDEPEAPEEEGGDAFPELEE